MGRFYKASSGRILLIENDEKLTQEEVDLADELQQIAFPDEWKDQNPNDKRGLDLILFMQWGINLSDKEVKNLLDAAMSG